MLIKKFKYKLLKIILLSLIMVLLPCGFVSAAEYYVDATNGNDNNNGLSSENAWKTIAKVNDFAENPGFSNGDVIAFKRGEVWRNDEPLGYDGSSINWGTINGLTIQDYGTGPKPWIDCTTQAAIYIEGHDKLSNLVIRNLDISGMGGISPLRNNMYIVRVTNFVIDGIYADGHKGTTNYVVKGPIKIGPNLGDVVIKNCEIFNIIHPDGLDKGYDIVINNYHIAESAKTTGSVKIINNTVHDVAGDILQPANVRPPEGFLIAGNLFYHFAENAIDLKSCSNVVIENNEIYRDFGGSNKYCEEYWPDKLFNFGMIVTHAVTDGPTCENITIRSNYIHSSGNFRGFEIGGANNLQIYNNYFKDIGRMELSSNGCFVYNNVWDIQHDPVCDNFIYCSLGTTSCSAPTLSLIAPSKAMRSCKIFNNTFYVKSNTINYGIYYRKYSNSLNSEIFNNIFYLDRDALSTYPFYFYIRDGSSDIPNVHNNLYFNPSSTKRVYWDGMIYNQDQQAMWRNAGHAGALFTDPLFIDATSGDFHLQSSSPATGMGSSWFPDFSECTEDWNCTSWSAWSECIANQQSRTSTCTDLNNCGTENNKPAETETQSCETPPTYGISDFINLVTDWLKSETNLTSDVNGDGMVNTRDLGIMMSNWQ